MGTCKPIKETIVPGQYRFIIDRGLFEVAKWNIENIVSKGGIVHLDTVRCYNFYNKKLSREN